MSATIKILSPLVLSLLIMVGAYFLIKSTDDFALFPREEEAPRVGALAPDFTLKDANGKTVRLADFRSKNPVFLNFWASWCPACREEAPQNEKLHQQLAPKGLVLLAVSVDRGPDAITVVKNFIQEFKLSFTPLLDSDGEIFELYAVTAIPTTFLISREGKIVVKEVGSKNWASTERLNRLEGLLNY